MENVSAGMRIKPKNQKLHPRKPKNEWTWKILPNKSRQTVSEHGGSEKSFTTSIPWRECIRLQPSGGSGAGHGFIFQPQH